MNRLRLLVYRTCDMYHFEMEKETLKGSPFEFCHNGGNRIFEIEKVKTNAKTKKIHFLHFNSLIVTH